MKSIFNLYVEPLTHRGIENEIQRIKTTRKVKSLEKVKQNIIAAPLREHNNFFRGSQHSSETNIYSNIEKLDKEIEVFNFLM